MYSLLDRNFSSSDYYPFLAIGKGAPISRGVFDTEQDILNVLNRFPMITQKVAKGHLPFWFLQSKDPQFDSSFIFTILRDPVSRVISHYHHKVREGADMKSPTEVCPNLMCRFLCSDPTLRGEALFEDCKRNLEGLDFIVFLDDFENGVNSLFNKLKLRLKGPIVPKNEGEKKRPITEEEKRKIRELNDLDIRLYEYADTYLRYKSR